MGSTEVIYFYEKENSRKKEQIKENHISQFKSGFICEHKKVF